VVIDVPADSAAASNVQRVIVQSLHGVADTARVVSVDVATTDSSGDQTQAVQPVDQQGRTFWESASLKHLAAEQGIEPIIDINELAGDFWPEDEGPDEFVNWLRDQRRHA
jgi:hypothetical protein